MEELLVGSGLPDRIGDRVRADLLPGRKGRGQQNLSKRRGGSPPARSGTTRSFRRFEPPHSPEPPVPPRSLAQPPKAPSASATKTAFRPIPGWRKGTGHWTEAEPATPPAEAALRMLCEVMGPEGTKEWAFHGVRSVSKPVILAGLMAPWNNPGEFGRPAQGGLDGLRRPWPSGR